MGLMRASALVIGVLASFLFGFGWRDLRSGSLPDVSAIASMLRMDSSRPRLSAEQVYQVSFNRISGEYYKPVDSKDLKYAGMEGMLASLGDPHTVFLVPEVAKEFALETRANFVGVGARLLPDDLGAKVMTVFEDGPAFKGGMKQGDIITGVDGESMMGKDIDQIVKRIRGEEGTMVRLQLMREEEPRPITITVKRAKITTPTVTGNYLGDTGIAYLTVNSFSQPTAEQFDRELDKLDMRRMKGIVIDMRYNPGGLLDTAVDLVSRFAENKTVVKMRYRDGREEVVRSYHGARRDIQVPVVVLIGEDTASAAEIFAGALRDYGMATLVGVHTYGKSAVQNVFELRDGASAKVTVAKFFLPAGQDISRKVDEDGKYVSGGLNPEITVKIDPDSPYVPGDLETDVQLQKAIEIIQAKR
jgi:carboxyl-terminal processing protease